MHEIWTSPHVYVVLRYSVDEVGEGSEIPDGVITGKIGSFSGSLAMRPSICHLQESVLSYTSSLQDLVSLVASDTS